MYPKTVMQAYSQRVTELLAENKRLRAVVEQAREALEASQTAVTNCKVRIAYIGHPAESRFGDGKPDWSIACGSLEVAQNMNTAAIAACDGVLNNGGAK